ncbi:Uncharacterised protein [Streptococcus pneumoniae]|nr:Uncharacterised protein [Streptococcus pneumoniae]
MTTTIGAKAINAPAITPIATAMAASVAANLGLLEIQSAILATTSAITARTGLRAICKSCIAF